MAYFNHAFSKCFVGTGEGFTSLSGGQLGTTGNILKTGEFAFVDPKTWKVLDTVSPPTSCCPLILAAGSLYSSDKNGPFHGGYLESNKSKLINPKYVNRFYKVEAHAAQANVIHVGNTAYTMGGDALTSTLGVVAGTGYVTATAVPVAGGTGVGMTVNITALAGDVTVATINSPGFGYTAADVVTIIQGGGASDDETVTIDTVSAATADCSCEFLCDETYSLRLDVKGSPALRFLNHQAYKTLDAYTGCCPDGSVTPTVVDSTEVFIKWATQIIEDPIMSAFVYPVVYSEAGDALYPPATDAAFIATQPVGTTTWDLYVSPGHTVGAAAGVVLTGAYVDTKFGDCTFQISDFYELEPLRLYASEVDLNGDPCTFSGCCVVTECTGLQAMGTGESALRDVIMSESYRQNFFHSDLRIREITQGDQILNVINRTTSYDRYCILHSVPRFNNPTGTFDNDQYMLDIIVPAGSDQSKFEEFMGGWLTGCSDCTELEVIAPVTDCTSTTPIPDLK
jgi:hypothetical protein